MFARVQGGSLTWRRAYRAWKKNADPTRDDERQKSAMYMEAKAVVRDFTNVHGFAGIEALDEVLREYKLNGAAREMNVVG